jgi:hypothetical protein
MRRFDEEVRLSKKPGVDGEEESLVSRQGDQVILESLKRKWSQRFLDLAGSAPDFPILKNRCRPSRDLISTLEVPPRYHACIRVIDVERIQRSVPAPHSPFVILSLRRIWGRVQRDTFSYKRAASSASGRLGIKASREGRARGQ